MYALSLALSVLSLLTVWMMVTVFILPPLAFYTGYKAYQARRRRPGPRSVIRTLVSALPMVLSVAVFALILTMINTGYQA